MFRIELSEVGYNRNSPLLKNIFIDDVEGKKILVTGPSGSGKTTFILAITGVLSNLLDGYVKGSINFLNLNPLVYEDFIRLPSKVGVVLQDPDKQLAMPRALDELIFTLENLGYSPYESDRLAMEYLKLVGLWDKRFKHIEDLSGGEKRRLTIASALAHNPDVLIFDEASASMDPWGIKIVRDYIDRIGGDKTVFLIEHKARYFIDLVDEVYVIHNNSMIKLEDIEELENYGVDVYLKKRFERVNRDSGDLVLKVKNLSIGYESPIITDIDLELHRGEIICVVGKNGSGKTTLLKTLSGFLQPLNGSIERHGKVFYVPQNPDLIFMFRSVEKEIRESCFKAGVECNKFYSELDIAGIPLDILPFKLSHGQRRWLGNLIASIYSNDVILFDEPTTGLDLNLYKWIVNQIVGLADTGHSIIIASHDPRIILDICDRAYIIEDGLSEVDVDYAIKYLEAPVNLNE